MTQPEDSSPLLTWILGYFWCLPRGVSPRLDWRHAVRFPPQLEQQCHASRRVDQGISVFPLRLSHEAFPGGFPTGLFHVPPWCESILGMKSRQCRENSIPWNGLRHLGDSGNGGTTLEFLSPFLRRPPPHEMRRECRQFFPNHAGKGSILSSKEA